MAVRNSNDDLCLADDEPVGIFYPLAIMQKNCSSYVPLLKTPIGRKLEGGLGILLALGAVGLGAFTDCDRTTIAMGYGGIGAVLDSIS